MQELKGSEERKGDFGYVEFKSAADKTEALLLSCPDLNMIRGQKYGKILLYPHDTHEILNFSHVTESNLSADDFIKNGIENVEEVFEFKRYDQG